MVCLQYFKLSHHNTCWQARSRLQVSIIAHCNWARELIFLQGVSSHGKPGKAMELHFLFPGLEKSWQLTPDFGKLIKSHGN